MLFYHFSSPVQTHSSSFLSIPQAHKKGGNLATCENTMGLEGFMLSQIRQTERERQICMNSLMFRILTKNKIIETEQISDCQRPGGKDEMGEGGQKV